MYDINHLNSRQCEYLLQVGAMRHQKSHHKTQHVIIEGLTSHHCNTQDNLELAIVCLKLSVGEKAEGQLSCMSSRGLVLWRKG